MTKMVLLGAGFSRAVSKHMPLMQDLAAQLTSRLSLDSDELLPFNSDVEAWLAFLATDEPWLDDADILRNRSQFVRVVRALNEVIVEAQTTAEAEAPPQWLDRVAWQWSHDQADVLTFNYDTLLESALRRLGSINSLSDLYVTSLTERLPAGSSRFLSASPSQSPLPRLYKLHGSVNWLHGGERAPVTDPLILRWDITQQQRQEPRWQRLYDGLEPFVIPPTSSKNRYYDRAAVRTQWKRAADALAEAESLDVVGYSFPKSDIGTLAFLGTSLAPEVPVRVIDPSPQALERIGEVLPRNERVAAFSSVDEYAQECCGHVVTAWYEHTESGGEVRVDVDGAVSVVARESEPTKPRDDLELILLNHFPEVLYVNRHDMKRGDYSVTAVRGFTPAN